MKVKPKQNFKFPNTRIQNVHITFSLLAWIGGKKIEARTCIYVFEKIFVEHTIVFIKYLSKIRNKSWALRDLKL